MCLAKGAFYSVSVLLVPGEGIFISCWLKRLSVCKTGADLGGGCMGCAVGGK